MVRDLARGTVQEVTRRFDRSVGSFVWLPDSRGIVFTAQDRHRNAVYRTTLSGQIEQRLAWGNTRQLSLAADGETAALLNDAIDRPGQIFLWNMVRGMNPTQLTAVNSAL